MRSVLASVSCALALASTALADSIVVFNEVMYHPPTNEPANEWIELYNQNAVDVDISGWSFTDGLSFTFPEGTIVKGRGYLVVASDPASFSLANGGAKALGPFDGRLGNSGDRLALSDRNHRVMDVLKYGVGGIWPLGPDGTGVTLAKRAPGLGSGHAESWTSSAEMGGTPGVRNFPDGKFEAPPGLLSYWSFDETGTIANDNVGGDTGTLSSDGVARSAGLVGAGALNFGPAGKGSVALGRSLGARLTGGDGITVEAIARPTWDGTGRAAFFRREADRRGKLVSYWSFDESISGTNIAVDPISGNNGLIRGGAARTNGLVGLGGILLKNGTLDGLNVGTGLVSSFSFSTGITVAAWIRPQWAATSNNTDAIFSKDDGSNRITFAFQNDSSNALGLVSVPAGPVLSFGLNIGGSYTELDMPLDGAAGRPTLDQLKDGARHHVAGTFDSASGLLGIWVDGSLRYSGTKVGPIRSGGTAQAYIGNRGPSGNQGFTGVIDEVALWSEALPGQQLATLAQGVTVPESGAVTSAGNRVHFGFRRIGDVDFTDPPVTPTPALVFGAMVGGTYRELELPLDGAEGRPALASLTDGKPHHFAAGYSAAAQQQWISVDGILRATLSVTGSLESTGIGLGTLGNIAAGGNEPFRGDLDEVTVWNRGLSGSVLGLHSQLMAAGLAFYQSLPLDLPQVSFNELAPASANPYWIELVNYGTKTVQVGGLVLTRSAGGQYTLPSRTLAPGALLVLSSRDFTFRPRAGELLALYSAGKGALLDSARVGAGPLARVQPGVGEWRVPTASTSGGTNTFAFHDEVVINEIFYHAPPTYSTAVEYTNRTLVSLESDWKYNQAGVDLGTAWRSPAYNDASWSSGLSLFYSTRSNLPAAKNTPLDLGPITYYFRKVVTLTNDPAGVTLRLRAVVDDGAVVYLNGAEVYRVNMKAGAVAYTNLANNVINASLGPIVTLSTSNWVAGDNVIAVEVHQSSATSDDVVFGLELNARVPSKGARPFAANPEQWLELYNRSSKAVDLSGWRFDSGVDYVFAPGTQIAPGAYLVLASDPDALKSKYPSLAPLGPWVGSLSGGGDRLVLKDAAGNPVNEVRYGTGGYWPGAADGGGSSLELKDPWADNSKPEAWAASDELPKSRWETITYSGIGSQNGSPPDAYNELVIGLLDTGEVLLDDIQVREVGGSGLIQNSDFETDLKKWRVLGNHAATRDVDPSNPNNHVMRMVATGMTEHMSNHAETTLKDGTKLYSLVDTKSYEISLKARWVSGSPQLNTRLFFNRLPKTTVLSMPTLWGTPGAANSRSVTNLGPTYTGLSHSPVVPAVNEAVTVSVTPSDHDGVTGCVLWWSTNAAVWASVTMQADSAGRYSAALPGQPAAKVVQFYVEATDGKGVKSVYPPDGRDSRALYQVADGLANVALAHNIRLVMTPADVALLVARTNQMSNGRIGLTVVHDEAEAVYDCGVRLKGSEHGRPNPDRQGFNIDYPDTTPFRGVHQTIAIDRSGGWSFSTAPYGQDEILITHIINHAGGTPATWNDLIRLIGPSKEYSGAAMLQMSRYGPSFLDAQFENGSANPAFEYELYYGQSETQSVSPDYVGVEGFKMPQEGGVSGYSLGDQGDDKENYRLGYIIKNARDKDDYETLISKLKYFSLGDSAFAAAADQILDVDEWLRSFALAKLCGANDNYSGSGSQHNLQLYVRPSDGKLIHLIWDTDFAFNIDPNSDLLSGGDLGRLLSRPANLRLYLSHLQDIVETTFNRNYMAYWVDHYDNFTPAFNGRPAQNWSSVLDYIGTRSAVARAALPKPIPFFIVNNGGQTFITNSGIATLNGRAWIDVREIREAGSSQPLDLTWTSVSNFVVKLPLMLGNNTFFLTAYHRDGHAITNASITVVGSSPTGGIDTDGDGIPDAWENIYDLNPLVPSANVDTDGDGYTDLQEYLAGTDPRSASSRLRIDSVSLGNDGARIRFSAVVGRRYRIEYRDAIEGGSWTPLTVIPAGLSDRFVDWVDPVATGHRRFYRVVTPAE